MKLKLSKKLISVPMAKPDAKIIPWEIIRAHNVWKAAEGKIPAHDYDKGYKSRTATAQRKWKIFSDLCTALDLKPVTVAHDIAASLDQPETEIKPSDLKAWKDVPKDKVFDGCTLNHPSKYGWYVHNGYYYPHRLPTSMEKKLDKFN